MAWYVYITVWMKWFSLNYVLSIGTKNVAKEIKSISEGRKRDKGISWFPELSDKSMCEKKTTLISCSIVFILFYFFFFSGRSIKIHLYWAMQNCEDNPETLRSMIRNIPSHYAVCYMTFRKLQYY